VVIIYRSLGYARDDIGVECVFSTEVSASERSGEIFPPHKKFLEKFFQNVLTIPC